MKLHQSPSGGKQLVETSCFIPSVFKYEAQNEVKTKLYSERQHETLRFSFPASFSLLQANCVIADMTYRRVGNTLSLLTTLPKGEMTKGIVSPFLPFFEASSLSIEGLQPQVQGAAAAGARG